MVYGLKIYNELRTYFTVNKTDTLINLPHILMEHKKLMVDRLFFMQDNEYLTDCQDIIEQYTAIYEKALLVKNLFMK